MKHRLLVVAVAASLVGPSLARADDLDAEPNDRGKVTSIRKGVKELDLGGIFVLSHNKSGDAEGQTRVASLGGIGFQYFINNNLSAGATVLASYDRSSATTYSTGFGGAVFGSLHLRLGLGAFLRPTAGVGMLVGSQNTEVMPGMLATASEVAFLARLALPFAYFPSKRIVLQAGPELNVLVGNATPDGGEAQTFTSVAGGFGVSAGYAF
ncbi:MAG TPA: hypothetical protein VFQ53_16070 [Kofleriaceae bacterium]|nr:hypothetical protein [Kofleriaceae bacterium]